jgi:hypothetical protein
MDKSKPYIPLAGGAADGWSTEDEATATCICGAVQLKFVSTRFRLAIHVVLTSDASQTSQPKTQGCSPRLSATVQTAERLPSPCSLQISLLQTRISRMSPAAKTQRRTARRTPSPQKTR